VAVVAGAVVARGALADAAGAADESPTGPMERAANAARKERGKRIESPFVDLHASYRGTPLASGAKRRRPNSKALRRERSPWKKNG
jgi:hypothetical protein